MKGKGLNQQQNKSQREIHPSSGWLQGAAVREVPGKEVESPVVGESGLNRSFVNVPVHGGGLPVVQRKLTKKASPEPGGRENNTGLPDNLKSGIENLSGYSLDNVKVHYNSNKPSQLQAHAYAQGTDIHVAAGQEKHLPHEAWHVVQQKQGRVKPTMQVQGVAINDNPVLEREADMMGVKATSVNRPDSFSVAQTKSNVRQNIRFVDNRSISTGVVQLMRLPPGFYPRAEQLDWTDAAFKHGHSKDEIIAQIAAGWDAGNGHDGMVHIPWGVGAPSGVILRRQASGRYLVIHAQSGANIAEENARRERKRQEDANRGDTADTNDNWRKRR